MILIYCLKGIFAFMLAQELIDVAYDAIKLPFSYFIDPKKRIYVFYLSMSFLIAFIIYTKNIRKKSFLRFIFFKRVWLGKSAQIDYALLVINGFIKVLLISPMVFLGIYLQELTTGSLEAFFGAVTIDIDRNTIVLMYTILIWLFGDFASFYLHYLFHKIPFLWEFHKTHHSATTLNPFTLYRIHPVELLINNFKSIIVFGLSTGIFYYLANGKVGIIGFLGVNVFKFIFLSLGANLRHSHIRFTFPSWLEHIFISPYQHHIHHSKDETHYNKNLGSHLAIWDLMFHTLIISKRVRKIQFGLGNNSN